MWIAVINFLYELPIKVWAVIIGLVLLLAIGGYLLHGKRSAELQLVTEKAERERMERQNEGLKVLINTANIAAEVESLREKANVQNSNSDNSNNIYANSRQRDSSESSNSFAEAKRRFCIEYPADSLWD